MRVKLIFTGIVLLLLCLLNQSQQQLHDPDTVRNWHRCRCARVQRQIPKLLPGQAPPKIPAPPEPIKSKPKPREWVYIELLPPSEPQLVLDLTRNDFHRCDSVVVRPFDSTKLTQVWSYDKGNGIIYNTGKSDLVLDVKEAEIKTFLVVYNVTYSFNQRWRLVCCHEKGPLCEFKCVEIFSRMDPIHNWKCSTKPINGEMVVLEKFRPIRDDELDNDGAWQSTTMDNVTRGDHVALGERNVKFRTIPLKQQKITRFKFRRWTLKPKTTTIITTMG